MTSRLDSQWAQISRRSERIHLSADYQRYDWRASASLNRADFYDLFGPTKVGRKGYRVLAGHKNALIFDEPRRLDLDLSGAVSGNLDRLPEFQNVPVNIGTLVTLRSVLTFTDVRNSLGYVDEETGRKWSVELRTDVVDGKPFPRVQGTFDRGASLPVGHSSIWLRTAAGLSPRDRTLPFANFFFGGFGNNYVDRGDEKRYRHLESFPGAELNEIEQYVALSCSSNRWRIAGAAGGVEGALGGTLPCVDTSICVDRTLFRNSGELHFVAPVTDRGEYPT